MKYLKNKIIHFLVFGGIYMDVEVLARAHGQQLVGYEGIKPLSLMGFTSLWMFLVGGLCGVIIGGLNDRPGYYNLKMWKQVLIGGTTITLVELFSGIFFNLYLGLHLWDYSKDRFNFMGQIELKNCIWWYVLPILIIWLDDVLSCYFYGDDRPPSLIMYLVKLVTLR
ncbi:membrane protein [Clostridium acetobutylicum]|nr:membrane protein [Clostridium acetobutylicum]